MCSCGGGGRAARPVMAPKLPNNNNVANAVAKLHPNAQIIQNVQRIAEEKRKIAKLRREQLLKVLKRP